MGCVSEGIESLLRSALPEYGVAPTPERLARLTDFLERLIRWNRRIRLVGSAAPEELVLRHVGESLFLHSLIPLAGKTLLDVGSGAGFPGLALQLAFPELSTTLVESNSRKAAFLQEVVRVSGLGRVIVARAEDVRERAEILTLRAVEGMERGPNRYAHLLIPGGKLAAWITLEMADRWRLLPPWHWAEPALLPGTRQRAILLGELPGERPG